MNAVVSNSVVSNAVACSNALVFHEVGDGGLAAARKRTIVAATEAIARLTTTTVIRRRQARELVGWSILSTVMTLSRLLVWMDHTLDRHGDAGPEA